MIGFLWSYIMHCISCRMAATFLNIIEAFQSALLISTHLLLFFLAFQRLLIRLQRNNHPTILEVSKYSGCRYMVDVLCNGDEIIEETSRSYFDFLPLENWRESNRTRQTKIEEKRWHVSKQRQRTHTILFNASGSKSSILNTQRKERKKERTFLYFVLKQHVDFWFDNAALAAISSIIRIKSWTTSLNMGVYAFVCGYEYGNRIRCYLVKYCCYSYTFLSKIYQCRDRSA